MPDITVWVRHKDGGEEAVKLGDCRRFVSPIGEKAFFLAPNGTWFALSFQDLRLRVNSTDG